MKRTTDPTDLPEVSEVIEGLRNEARLGVGELAERVGVSRESVRKWLRGTSVPSSANARSIATACGRNPGYLLQYAHWPDIPTDGRNLSSENLPYRDIMVSSLFSMNGRIRNEKDPRMCPAAC